MYVYDQQNPLDISERHRTRHGGSPDYLTCGDCAREFLLENITLFIAHKAWGCPDKVRTRRPGDIDEDTSSPLTCSVCSRVYMTARGLLQHVQSEHGMAICLRRGPLIISDKRLPSPGPVPSPPCPHTDHRSSPAPAKSPQCCPNEKPLTAASVPYQADKDAESSPVRQDNSYHHQTRGEMASVPVDHGEDQDKPEEVQPRDRGEFDLEENDNEPKDLSQRSTSATRSDHIRFSSEERPRVHDSADHAQAGRQTSEPGNSCPLPDRERTNSSSSVPKKRRYTLPEQVQGHVQDVRELSAHAKDGYSSGPTSSERPTSKEGYMHGDCVGGAEEEDLDCTRDADREDIIDSGQYRDEEQDSPICLVVGNSPSQLQGTAAENAKNIILKRLLLRNGTASDAHGLSISEAHPSPPSLLVMPKLEIDTGSLMTDHVDSRFGEHQATPFPTPNQSTPITSSGSSQKHHHHPQQQQQRYLRAPYPRFLSESSIEQSIDQILRASVNKDIDDPEISNDSLERTPPQRPPSSSCTPGPHLLSGATTSYQAIPLTMPSLIASHQLGTVAGYFSPQSYSSSGSRRSSAGPMPYPIPTGSTATSPGGMSAPDNALDISSSGFETGGLYPVVREGAVVPHLALGYHHKTGLDGLRRGATDYKASYGAGAGATSLYRGDIDLHHWAAIAGDAYAGSMANRMHSDQPGTEAQATGSEFDDPKGLVDGRMKKRRYPTSRPFKCAHCDQAFNQRIHLKKHMSKHTGVKPFKCQQCDYSTVERSHLKVHYRIHTGEKPYRCMFCDYATAQNSTLKIHLKRHHEGQQPVARDAHATGSGRRDTHKIQHEDPEPSVMSTGMREHFEGVAHDTGHPRYGHNYNGIKSDVVNRRSSAAQGEKGAHYKHASRGHGQKHDPQVTEADAPDRLHPYLKRQGSSGVSPGSPCPALPGAENGGDSRKSTEDAFPSAGTAARRVGTSENLLHDRKSSAPVWPEMLDGRQTGQLEYQRQTAKAGPVVSEPAASSLYLERTGPARRSCGEEEKDNSAALNFTSSENSWSGQKQMEEGRKDVSKHTSETPKTEGIVKVWDQVSGMGVSSDKAQSADLDNASQREVEAGAAAEVKNDDYEDDYSDDEDNHMNYENVKAIVVPDKAFVRG